MWDALSPYRDDLMLYGLGAFAMLVGLWKLVELSTTGSTAWAAYLPRWFTRVIPVSATVWMYIVGVVETTVGAALLARWNSHVVAAVASLWLFSIAVAVATAGAYDVAYRDLGLSIFALTVSLNEYLRS